MFHNKDASASAVPHIKDIEDDSMRSKIISKFSRVGGRSTKEFTAQAEEFILAQNFANTVEGQVLMPTGVTKQKHAKSVDNSSSEDISDNSSDDDDMPQSQQKRADKPIIEITPVRKNSNVEDKASNQAN